MCLWDVARVEKCVQIKKEARFKGAMSWFLRVEKLSLNCLSSTFVVRVSHHP